MDILYSTFHCLCQSVKTLLWSAGKYYQLFPKRSCQLYAYAKSSCSIILNLDCFLCCLLLIWDCLSLLSVDIPSIMFPSQTHWHNDENGHRSFVCMNSMRVGVWRGFGGGYEGLYHFSYYCDTVLILWGLCFPDSCLKKSQSRIKFAPLTLYVLCILYKRIIDT